MKTATSVVRGLPVEVELEPILAWRSWTLTGRRDGEGLLLRPVTAGSRAWRPREVAQATCRLAWSHEAPNADCSCGLHATGTWSTCGGPVVPPSSAASRSGDG